MLTLGNPAESEHVVLGYSAEPQHVVFTAACPLPVAHPHPLAEPDLEKSVRTRDGKESSHTNLTSVEGRSESGSA